MSVGHAKDGQIWISAGPRRSSSLCNLEFQGIAWRHLRWERDLAGKVFACVPLTAGRGGACLWRHIVRDTRFHLHLHTWIKGLEERRGLFGSGSIKHFSCTHIALGV